MGIARSSRNDLPSARRRIWNARRARAIPRAGRTRSRARPTGPTRARRSARAATATTRRRRRCSNARSRSNPSDVTAQDDLGETLLACGDPRGAEAAYRMALRRQADNADAIRGLVGALAAQGRGDEALEFANRLNAEQQSKAGGINKLRGEAQAAQARAAEARGDLGSGAQSLRRCAAEQSRRSVAAARPRAHLRAAGRGRNARSMMDGLLAAASRRDRRALRERAAVGRDAGLVGGLAQLERIPVRAAHRRDDHAAASAVGPADKPNSLMRARAPRAAPAGVRDRCRRAEPVAVWQSPELIGAVASRGI